MKPKLLQYVFYREKKLPKKAMTTRFKFFRELNKAQNSCQKTKEKLPVWNMWMATGHQPLARLTDLVRCAKGMADGCMTEILHSAVGGKFSAA